MLCVLENLLLSWLCGWLLQMHNFSLQLLESEATKESNAELFEDHPPSVLHFLDQSIGNPSEGAIYERRKQDQMFELVWVSTKSVSAVSLNHFSVAWLIISDVLCNLSSVHTLALKWALKTWTRNSLATLNTFAPLSTWTHCISLRLHSDPGWDGEPQKITFRHSHKKWKSPM